MAKTTRYKSESTLTVESERFSGLSIELYNKLNEQGHPIYIVRHTDLVAAIDSQEVRANGCRYEFGPIQIIGDMHYLVECVIRDGNGNFEIREHGEVMQDTLLTEISKQYPAKMCLNRAFDRAAIRYLGLGKRVYSSEEIEPSTLKDNVTVESTQNAHEAAGRQVAEEHPDEFLPFSSNHLNFCEHSIEVFVFIRRVAFKSCDTYVLIITVANINIRDSTINTIRINNSKNLNLDAIVVFVSQFVFTEKQNVSYIDSVCRLHAKPPPNLKLVEHSVELVTLIKHAFYKI